MNGGESKDGSRHHSFLCRSSRRDDSDPRVGVQTCLLRSARSNGAMWLRESGRPHRIVRSRPSGRDDEVGQIADSRYSVVTMR